MFKFASVLLLLCFSFCAVADIFKAKTALEKDDYDTAKSHFRHVAEVGNAEAQYALGLFHYEGKAGEVDKVSAFSWLFLASEYEYPNADVYASAIYNELNEEQKKKALKQAEVLSKKFGANALVEKIYPILTEEKIASQVIEQPANELSRLELRSDDLAYVDKAARALKARVDQTQLLISRLNKGYRHNAFDNLDKLNLEDISGLVIVKHDVDKLGKVINPEVLFSYPRKTFDEAIIDSVAQSTFSPAMSNGEPVEQYGVVTSRRIGAVGPNSFRTKYPLRHREFLKAKRLALEEGDTNAKYVYATILRAYGDIIAAEQPTTYQELLRELADEGVVQAQLEYAQYLIFQENDIDLGLGWLVRAVKAGHVEAEYRLGSLILRSPSSYLLEDKSKAAYWLSRAAEKGHDLAAQHLAKLNLKGELNADDQPTYGK